MSKMGKNLKDRNEAILWARGLMARTDWFIMDTETTGLKQTGSNLDSYDEIVQIGIINPHGQTVFESLVNPTKRRISQEAKEIHGIDLRMLKDAPRFRDIVPKLCEILNGKVVIAYNAEFEKQMLIQTYAKTPKEFRKADMQITFQCAMDEYSHFLGEWSDYYDDYKYQKLPGSCHNVIGDCVAILNLIKEMANAELSPTPDPTANAESGLIPDSWWKNLLNFFRKKR
jgi:DNA polymerase-3 subunit epsilon